MMFRASSIHEANNIGDYREKHGISRDVMRIRDVSNLKTAIIARERYFCVIWNVSRFAITCPF